MTQGPAMRNSGRSIPTWCPASCKLGPGGLRKLRGALRARGADEAREQRVPVPRGGGEFRVKLRGDEPRMTRQLDHLDQAVAREPGEAHAGLAVALEVVVVELVAV